MQIEPKTIYCDIEDGLQKVSKLLEQEKAVDITLVFPKRSYLFGDSLNLRLLKKQADLLGKKLTIVTADERGQVYAKDAGFQLRPISALGKKVESSKMGREEVADKPTEQVKSRVKKVTRQVKGGPKIVPSPRLISQDTIFPDVSEVTSLLRDRQDRHIKRKGVFTAVLVGVICGSILSALVVLPEAKVAIALKKEPISRNFELRFKSEISDLESLALKSQVVDRELTLEKKFQTLGKKEIGSKAGGKIRVVNLTGAPLNLRNSTTVFKSGGQEYKLTVDIVSIPSVPASKAKDENAGLELDVVAVNPGSSANLPKNTVLEVRNQVFGFRPDVLFAKVSREITGGNSRFLSVIDSNDITQAKENLTYEVLEGLAQTFASDGLVISKNASRKEVLEFTTSQTEGAETTSFAAKIKLRIRTVAFSKADAMTLLRKRVELKLEEGQRLQSAHLDKAVFRLSDLPDEKGNGSVSVEYQSNVLPEFSAEKAFGQVWFKTGEQILETVKSHNSVYKAVLEMRPKQLDWMPLLPKKVVIYTID